MIQTYEYNKNNLSQISQMEPGKFYTCPDEIEQEYRKKFDQSYNYTHNYTNIQHCPGMFPALPVSLNCGRDQEVKVSSKNDKSTK